MAQRSVYLGKENVPPSSLAAKRMKMVIMNEDDDGLVREATPKKNPFIKPAVVATTQVSTNVPLVPLAIPSPEAEKKEEEDDDEVVVIRPRSPRSPSASVPSSIALEAQQLLTSLSSSTDISVTTLPPPSEVSVSPPLTDVEQPSSEQVIEETTPPSEVVASTIEETKEEATESETLITPPSPSIAQAPVENESNDETNREEAAPEIPIVIESENTKEDVKVSDDVNISSEPQAESKVPSSSSSDLVISEEKKAEVVAEEDEKMKKADEIKKVEEARAQELAARSIARIEAEAAAQARRTQLEAKLAQLETLQLPLSDAAQATRSAVEERIAAVEEAWRRKVESKEAIVQSVESRSLAKRSDSTLPSSSSATTTSECPTSPSIEERKRRIERLRNERLEMKMRLDLSRSTNPPRKDISNNNNKKKSLRWADANGEKLTVATSFLVVNEEDEQQPTHRSTVPPPLPEEAPPSKIPARYLEGTAAVGDN